MADQHRAGEQRATELLQEGLAQNLHAAAQHDAAQTGAAHDAVEAEGQQPRGMQHRFPQRFLVGIAPGQLLPRLRRLDARGLGGLPGVLQDQLAVHIPLQAAPVAAVAGAALVVDGEVADLPGGVEGAGVDVAAGDQGAADAVVDLHEHHVQRFPGLRAGGVQNLLLGIGQALGVVEQVHGHAHLVPQALHGGLRHVQAQGRLVHDSLLQQAVYTGEVHADHQRPIPVKALGAVGEDVLEQRRVLVAGILAGQMVRGEGVEGGFQHLAVQVQQRILHALPPQGEHGDLEVVGVQAQTDGPPTRQGGLGGAGFGDQAALGQLLHQHGYAGGAQLHAAHQVRAGLAAAAAHQVEDVLDVSLFDLLLIAGAGDACCVQG